MHFTSQITSRNLPDDYIIIHNFNIDLNGSAKLLVLMNSMVNSLLNRIFTSCLLLIIAFGFHRASYVRTRKKAPSPNTARLCIMYVMRWLRRNIAKSRQQPINQRLQPTAGREIIVRCLWRRPLAAIINTICWLGAVSFVALCTHCASMLNFCLCQRNGAWYCAKSHKHFQ